MTSLRRFILLTLFVWMFVLHIAARASTGTLPQIQIDRVRLWNELKPLTLADFLDVPTITLKPSYLSKTDLPVDVRSDKEFKMIEELLSLQEKEEFDKAYLTADKLFKVAGKSALAEWILLLKADFLFRVQEKKESPKYALVLDEYLDVLRRYPLHAQAPRILYQMALLQVDLTYYKEADETASRGLKEFGQSEFAPLYMLLRGEQAFRAENFVQSLTEFTSLIDQFPRSHAAIDAAFRKAYIHFKRGDVEASLKTYENLERFHSEEVRKLKERNPAEEGGRLIDRSYYAETLYLNGQYEASSKLFQDLSNLFPLDPMAPFLSLRFADTFFQRGQFRAADQLYRNVLERPDLKPAAAALARIKLADLLFLTKDIRAHRENEIAYEEAYQLGKKAENMELAAFSLARLASHFLAIKSYPKAQQILRRFREEFKGSRNQKWAETQWSRTLELEITDYYNRGDYLAALATYLVADKDAVENTRVLLSLAEAAEHLALYEKTSALLNRVIYLEKTSEGRQEALLKLAGVLIHQGDYRRASERLRRFNFAYPTTPLKFLYDKLWGDLYTKLKNPEKASHHYELALEGTKTLPDQAFALREVLLQLAEHYEAMALPGQAVEAYNRFVAIVKENPLSAHQITPRDQYLVQLSRYKIADLFFTMKDYVKALEAYRSVAAEAKSESFITHAKYRMGECFIALDDRKSAIAAFKEVKSDDPNNLWAKAAESYIKTVEMEVKYGIKILN